MTFTLVGISAHPVWIGLMLSYFLGFRLHWFPITGYCDFAHPAPGETCGGPLQWTYHLILPWFALSVVALTLIGFVVSSPIGIAPVWVAAAGAIVLALRERPRPLELLRAAEPGFLVFVLALGILGTSDVDMAPGIFALDPNSLSIALELDLSAGR